MNALKMKSPGWLLCLLWLSFTVSAEQAASPDDVLIETRMLLEQDKPRDALRYIQQARERFPRSMLLAEEHANVLMGMERLAEAKRAALSLPNPTENLLEVVARVDSQLARYAKNYNLAVIYIQKRIDLQDYLSAVAVADLALVNFPDKQRDLYTLKGEALYKNNDLEAAEVELRKALRIDPLNSVAKRYVEEIRSTLEAQTSTAFAEWMSIARDKVGDFIVTFLALFAAFIANALMAPMAMRIKLNRARRSFEEGDYDDFTDLIEGLLDAEDFSPLRANLRYVLKQKGYDEVRDILDKHVVTVDRLPSLQRLLEREHEKMLQT